MIIKVIGYHCHINTYCSSYYEYSPLKAYPEKLLELEIFVAYPIWVSENTDVSALKGFLGVHRVQAQSQGKLLVKQNEYSHSLTLKNGKTKLKDELGFYSMLFLGRL